jgi:hypothetical protein
MTATHTVSQRFEAAVASIDAEISQVSAILVEETALLAGFATMANNFAKNTLQGVEYDLGLVGAYLNASNETAARLQALRDERDILIDTACSGLYV